MKKIIFSFFIIFSFSLNLKAQGVEGYDYILIDKDFIRGDIAFTQLSLDYKGIPTRSGSGVHTKIAGGIVSNFIKEQHKIMFYDEFYCNLSIGKLTSKPLYYFASKESGMVFSFMFGYDALLGYNTQKFAAYAGVRLQMSNAFVGSSELSGDKLLSFTHPYMVRGEYKINGSPYFKFVLMAWSNFNNLNNNTGFNLDIPISKRKRIWLTFQYEHLTCPKSSPATYDNYKYTPGIFNQWFAGIKVGSLH